MSQGSHTPSIGAGARSLLIVACAAALVVAAAWVWSARAIHPGSSAAGPSARPAEPAPATPAPQASALTTRVAEARAAALATPLSDDERQLGDKLLATYRALAAALSEGGGDCARATRAIAQTLQAADADVRRRLGESLAASRSGELDALAIKLDAHYGAELAGLRTAIGGGIANCVKHPDLLPTLQSYLLAKPTQ